MLLALEMNIKGHTELAFITQMNTLKEGREHFNNNHSIIAELEHYILLLFLSIYPARCHYFFKLAYILLKGNVFSRKTRIISKKIDFYNRMIKSFFFNQGHLR